MPWLKLLLDIAWALIALSVLQAVYNPQGTYWITISRVVQVRSLVYCQLMLPLSKFHQRSFWLQVSLSSWRNCF